MYISVLMKILCQRIDDVSEFLPHFSILAITAILPLRARSDMIRPTELTLTRKSLLQALSTNSTSIHRTTKLLTRRGPRNFGRHSSTPVYVSRAKERPTTDGSADRAGIASLPTVETERRKRKHHTSPLNSHGIEGLPPWKTRLLTVLCVRRSLRKII